MIHHRYIQGVASVILCLSLLTGCWDSNEIDDLAIVLGSGIDLAENDQAEATVQIAAPTGIPTGGNAGSQQEPFLTLTEKGQDSADIINRMQQHLSRRFFLGHRAVIVFGEEYAKHGIDQIVDEFLRSPDSRYTGFVLTTYGTTAKEVISSKYMLENIPAIAIKKMQEEGNTLATSVGDFMATLASDEKNTVTGAIRMVESNSSEKFFLIDHAAVYQDNKLAGFLNEEQMKMLLWQRGKIQGTTMTIQMEPKSKKFKGTVGILFLKGTTQIKTKIEDGKPHVTVNFKAKTKVLENSTKLDMSKEKNIEKVQNKFVEDIEKTLKEVLDLAQNEWNVDIFDFAEEIHIQHPSFWKKEKAHWSEIYPTVPVTFQVNLKIERTGRTQAPAHLKD